MTPFLTTSQLSQNRAQNPTRYAVPTRGKSRLMLGLAGAVAMFAMAPQFASAAQFDLPDGSGRKLIYAKCQVCHDLQYVVESQGLTGDAWDGLLDDMEGFGVELSADERKTILTYLATYMSNTPPPAPAVTEVASSDAPVDGAAVFMDNCTSCHQENAQGVEETFPPLAGNDDLFLSQDFPARVLLNGMTGAITVNGGPYQGEMPSFDFLEDGEIAAVVNFLRNNFGNDAAAHDGISTLKPVAVQALRDQPMTPPEVLAYRKSRK